MRKAIVALVFGLVFLPSLALAQYVSIGRQAYTGDLKLMPTGYYDFVEFNLFNASSYMEDAFCDQWEKVISVHKRVREKMQENQLHPRYTVLDAIAEAVYDVNIANKQRVCWLKVVNMAVTHVARRGYKDDHSVLRPVVIFRVVSEGRIIYGGYHDNVNYY